MLVVPPIGGEIPHLDTRRGAIEELHFPAVDLRGREGALHHAFVLDFKDVKEPLEDDVQFEEKANSPIDIQVVLQHHNHELQCREDHGVSKFAPLRLDIQRQERPQIYTRRAH